MFNGSFSSKSFALESFRYVPNPGEKIIANITGQQPSVNIYGEVKEVEFKKSDTVPGQFNIIFNNYTSNSSLITSNQSILQYDSIEYILTFTSQQNMSIENKTILQAQIKYFEQECKKTSPDQGKLKSIHGCLMYEIICHFRITALT